MERKNGRTVLVFGAAVVAAGAAVVTAVNAQAPAAPGAAAAPAPPPVTPRTADGKPDLSGMWVTGGVGGIASGNEFVNFAGRGGNFVGFEADGSLFRTSTLNKPLYKPEYWDQVTDLEFRGNWEDPVSQCWPLGAPRSGGPHQILNVAGKPLIVLLYQAGFNGYGGSYQSWDQHRIIWTDNRKPDPRHVALETSFGAPAAYWDGDTLVIESVGFTDWTWLHKNGWIHGFNMKVTERLTRNGNTLTWEATVEDPDYLMEPWKMTPMVRQLNPDPNGFLPESLPCLEREPYASPTRSG